MKTIDFSFDNVGGMSRLWLIGAGNVLRLDRNFVQDVWRLSLRTREEVYRLDTTQGDYSFTERLTEDEKGRRYEVFIGGFVPRLDHVCEVERLERGAWLALHIDGNGCILLSGTPSFPLRFSGQKTQKPSNGTNFELRGTLPGPSLRVDGRAFYL